MTLEFSRLARKEIINLFDGARLGYVGESDLVIDNESGEIEAIIIVPRGLSYKISRAVRELVIPWNSIKKIGEEVMIVEISPGRTSRSSACHE